MLTNEQLKAIMPHAPKAKREASLPILNDVAKAYDISNERRMAAWLATLAVESGELKYQEEIASGSAYEGRKDLGNTQAGDGRRFKGHGRIQITGRFNHQAYTTYLKKSGHLPFIDFITEPKKLAQEPYATDSAGWFFAAKIKANPLADAGDFLRIQIKVNGRNKRTGLPNHWAERNAYWVKGLSVLPNNFNLTNSAADPATQNQPDGIEEGAVERSEKSTTATQDPSPINQQTEGQTQIASTIVNTVDTQTPPPSDVPITVEKQQVSFFAKIGAVITAITGIGINAGSLIQSKLEEMTVAQVVYLALALGLVAVAVWWYQKAAKGAQNRTLQLVDKAADPSLNTIKLVDKIETPVMELPTPIANSDSPEVGG